MLREPHAKDRSGIWTWRLTGELRPVALLGGTAEMHLVGRGEEATERARTTIGFLI
jgi:hypothetical protein